VKRGIASKAGRAALTFALLSGNSWAANCARPQELMALQTAALQQNLMVAAFTCRDTSAYNGFVTFHQSELQQSDKALMSFFVQRSAQTGVDDYSTFKTSLANDSSVRSLHDDQFCSDADASFAVALDRKVPLAELVTERPSPIQTGFVGCMPGESEAILVTDATPVPPARHHALLEDAPAAAFAAPAAPAAAPPPDRDLPPIASPRVTDNRHRDSADDRSGDRGVTDNRHRDSADDRSGDRSGYDNRPDYAPDTDESSNGPRMVLGRDGHWYLLRSNDH